MSDKWRNWWQVSERHNEEKGNKLSDTAKFILIFSKTIIGKKFTAHHPLKIFVLSIFNPQKKGEFFLALAQNELFGDVKSKDPSET